MIKVTVMEVGDTNKIYPVILSDEKEMILVDCGYPGFVLPIKQAAESKGVDLERITKIIITHHDFDHMGALAEFKDKYPNIQVISSVEEEKYISGKEKSLRLQQAESIYASLPEGEKQSAEKFHKLLSSIRTVDVDLTVKDGDEFSWCEGVEVIATPGHMPGHICVYLKESKTLIAGDALVVENNELGIANPQYTLDIQQARKSIEKLLNYDIKQIICYHGGIFIQDIKKALERLTKE